MKKIAIEIRNPLTEPLNKAKRELVQNVLFDGVLENSQTPLSLYSYLSERPEKFYCKNSFSKQYEFLNCEINRVAITTYLNSYHSELDNAFKILNQINNKSWHDPILPDEFDFLRLCENDVNPTYLSLIEGVFGPLVSLNAVISRESRGKSINGLDIYNRFQEIERTEMAFISNFYCNTTRNSIAHGSVRYLHRDIEFKDKNKTVINTHSEYIKRFDSTLDVCNGLSLAYKKFLFENDSKVKIPKQLFLDELYVQTETPWWRIEGNLESILVDNKKQLIIYVSPKTRDYSKVMLSSIWSAVLAESLAPGYDRYLLSLRAPFAYQGFAVFNGDILLDRREKNISNWSDYSGALENNLIYWIPFTKFPKLLFKLHTYVLSLKMYFLMQRNLIISRDGYEIHNRNNKIHRNGWRVVLNADVVIESINILTTSDIKDKGRNIISSSLKVARKKIPWYSIVKYLPLGYARVAIFEKDHRCRELINFGLRKQLIGNVQIQKIKRIKSPDIFGATIEYSGKFKYAWNEAWLNQQLSE